MTYFVGIFWSSEVQGQARLIFCFSWQENADVLILTHCLYTRMSKEIFYPYIVQAINSAHSILFLGSMITSVQTLSRNVCRLLTLKMSLVKSPLSYSKTV